jgi:hypothetical protein
MARTLLGTTKPAASKAVTAPVDAGVLVETSGRRVKLDNKRTFGEPVGTAPDELWIACPGLEVVWVGETRFSSGEFGPRLVCEWRRP